MGQKAVIADLGKSPWQDMKEKPPDKLSSSNGEFFFFIVVTALPVAEPYFTVIDIINQVVGDGHPMSIAAEILEDLLSSAKGLLGIGDPLLVPQSV